MEEADILTTVAQLAIGVAGFSGIAMVFKREPGQLTAVEAYRVAILFANAFAAMFLALLPFPLDLLFGGSQAAWRIASTLTALFGICFLTYFELKTRRFRRDLPELFNRFSLSLVRGGHIVNMIVQAANAAGWFGAKAAAVFVFGVLWLLFHATYQFGRILFVQPARVHAPPTEPEPAGSALLQ